MPWTIALGVSLFLFLLAPFFRKWVDLVVWPKIADSWASRSRSKTQERINKLEIRYSAIQQLPLLTDFEDIVLQSLSGLFMTLMVAIPAVALMGYIILRLNRNPTWPETYRLIVIFLLGGIVILLGIGVQKGLERFRLDRNAAYRASLNKNIENLRARLT